MTILVPSRLDLRIAAQLSLLPNEDPYLLIVETGIGVAHANSYASLESARNYFVGRRLYSSAWIAASDDDKKIALKQASNVLDSEFFWAGDGALTTTQGLAWPRVNARDRDNKIISGLPKKVHDATCEVAMYLLAQERLIARDGVGLSSITVDVIKLVFDRKQSPLLFPEYVSRMLNGYGTPVRSATQIRNVHLYRV